MNEKKPKGADVIDFAERRRQKVSEAPPAPAAGASLAEELIRRLSPHS